MNGAPDFGGGFDCSDGLEVGEDGCSFCFLFASFDEALSGFEFVLF
ncbi:hypothetical protein [Edaphobacter bradus]|nr:hypothetical protein [Edaphobacter bradus]